MYPQFSSNTSVFNFYTIFFEFIYTARLKNKIPTAVFQHEWTKWNESAEIFYFWDIAHTVKIASQAVQ